MVPISPGENRSESGASATRSGCLLIPRFFDRDRADAMFAALLAGVDWRTERIRMFGRAIDVPRLVAWCGDKGTNYRYSGLDHLCDGWLTELEPLRDRLARQFGFSSSMALLNRYRDGRDGMGWHTDDEAGQGPWIASLSLGAARRFCLRSEPRAPVENVILEHGTLLLLRAATPHALPKTARQVDERINVTFRQQTGQHRHV